MLTPKQRHLISVAADHGFVATPVIAADGIIVECPVHIDGVDSVQSVDVSTMNELRDLLGY